jgi:hypothetical protein
MRRPGYLPGGFIPESPLDSVALLFRHSTTPLESILSAAAVGVCWWIAIAGSVAIQRGPAGMESGFAIEFAGMTNTTASILMPMGEILQRF